MNSFQLRLLDFTYTFPPVYSFTKHVVGLNYRKQFHSFMNGIETILIWIAAIAIVLYRKWIENNCTEHLQLFALSVKDFSVKAYTWFVQIGVPGIIVAVDVTHQAGVQSRRFYDQIFISLSLLFSFLFES